MLVLSTRTQQAAPVSAPLTQTKSPTLVNVSPCTGLLNCPLWYTQGPS